MVNPDETTIIEIPAKLHKQPVVVAKRKYLPHASRFRQAEEVDDEDEEAYAVARHPSERYSTQAAIPSVPLKSHNLHRPPRSAAPVYCSTPRNNTTYIQQVPKWNCTKPQIKRFQI